MRERVALIGTGHIGGSLVLAMRAQGLVASAVGFDQNRAHASEAQSLGIIDTVAPTLEAAIAGATLVLLTTPIAATLEVLAAIGKQLAPGVLVHDVASTKASIVATAKKVLAHPSWFVGGHPLAGTERSGPSASNGELFAGRIVYVTPEATTSPDALAKVKALWQSVGSRTVEIDPAAHDEKMAYVSHLPHIVAYALTAAVTGEAAAACGVGPEDIGGGFRDTTRIASSSAVMWRDIFIDNREALCLAWRELDQSLAELRRLIEDDDGEALAARLAEIRERRERMVRK